MVKGKLKPERGRMLTPVTAQRSIHFGWFARLYLLRDQRVEFILSVARQTMLDHDEFHER